MATHTALIVTQLKVSYKYNHVFVKLLLKQLNFY